MAYSANYEFSIETTKVTVSLYDGYTLWKKIEYPIKLRKEELQLQHTYVDSTTLKLNFVLNKMNFHHALRIRTNKFTFFID